MVWVGVEVEEQVLKRTIMTSHKLEATPPELPFR
jgi:hypothetical protein